MNCKDMSYIHVDVLWIVTPVMVSRSAVAGGWYWFQMPYGLILWIKKKKNEIKTRKYFGDNGENRIPK